MSARMLLVWLLLILSSAPGCATTRRTDILARPFGSGKSSPKKPEVDSTVEEKPAREPLVAGTAPQPNAQKYKHDPATRLLIQTELKDLPEEERQQWMDYLESIETGQVSMALRARRKYFSDHPIASNGTEGPAGDAATRELSLSRGGHSGFRAQSTGTVVPEIIPAAAVSDGKSDLSTSPIEPISGSTAVDGTSSVTTPDSGEGSRARLFPGMPEWETPRLWPAGKDVGGTAAEPDSHRSGGRFPFPQLRPAREHVVEGEQPVPVAVRPPFTPPALTSPASAETPINSSSSVWENEMRKLISLLEADAMVLQPGMSLSDQREYLRRQVALRMLYLMENEPERAQQVIAGLPAAEQEFWSALFWGLASYVDESVNADPAVRATLTIEQLRAAIHHLQSKAHLELENLMFCREIQSFGNYQAFESNRFAAGQTILLYCEVRNFKSEPTSSGDYRTVLKSSMEIHRDAGEGVLIERNQFDATEDRSRSPREDYFHSYRVNLPSHLTPGPYLLKLKVEDQLSRKFATETIAFEIR